MAKKLTSNKAKKILHDKSVHGKPLTDKQRRFFGAIAGGAKPYKAESGGWLDKYDKAQVGIEVPEYALRHMTGDIQSRGPNLAHKARMDDAVQRAKEKRDQEARTRTTISADTRSEAQRKKDAQAAAARRKYEEEVLGNDLSRPSAEKARNREEAERIIHNLVDVPMTLMGAGELAYLGGRGLMKTVPNVTKSLIVQSPSTTKSNLNNIITEKLKEQYPSWFIKESAKTKATDELSKIEAENFLKSFLQDPDKQALYTPVNLKIPAYGQTNLGLNPHLEGGRQFRVVDEGSGIFRKRADKLEDGFNMYDLLQSTQYHLRKNKFGGIVKAQNGIEGTMGGLTDKGFNYNGAWGGTMQDGGNLMPAMAGANQTVPMAQLGDSVKPIPMQLAMGGSLPGSVGFTYARTIDPAPSNGPYAKKTKASAQNGMEMKYYQEGLDFKPKTISKNGGWLDKYDKAQAGEEIPAYLLGPMRGDIQSRGPNLANKAKMDEAVREAREKREQDAERQKAIDQRNKEKARDYQEAINKSKSKPLTQASAKDIREQEYNRKYKASKESEARRVAKEEQLAKEKERAMIAEGKAAEATRENSNVPFTFPTGETKLWKDMDWREKQYVAGRNLGSMSRFNNWTDWINPVTYIGEMAEGLSTAPYVARETDSNIPYATGVGAPLLAGALGGGKSARQFLSNVANPVPVPASNIGRGFSKLMELPSYLPLRLETGAKSFLMGSILGGAEGTLGLLSRLVGKPAKTRSFQEIFPMSQTAKLAAQKESKQAVAEGDQFVKDWAYDESGFARPDVTRKVENILTGEGSPINPSVRFENNWEVLNQSPLNYIPSKSVNTRFSNILNNPYLTPKERGRVLSSRASAYGVNYADDTTLPASYTFENIGPYNFPYEDKLLTTVHEGAHTLQEFGATQFIPAISGNFGSLEKTTVGEMLSKLYPEYKYWSPNLETSIGKKFAEAMVPPKKGKRVWEASPVELHSELMAARLKLVKDYQEKGMGYQEAINVVKNETDRQLDEMIKMQKLNRFFKKGVSQEKKRELLRLLPAAVPVVGAASVLAQDQPPQQRDGGEIAVDPMGYWNPENVGNPVIIPSNIITMEGVDQPLIGISDTGDIQYMEPGEDYEFEGESVLEMPVARGGVSVNNADAQPLKKLDQLLNFTNYNKPTRGGWLDKYK